MNEWGVPTPKVGHAVLLGLGEGDGEAREWHQARVAGLEDGIVWVEAPRRDGRPVLPRTGADVLLHTWQDLDGRYTAQATVVGSGDGGRASGQGSIHFPTRDPRPPSPVLGLRVVGGLCFRHREHFRVPAALSAKARADRADGLTWLFSLQIEDISAGGIRAVCPVPLSPGSQLSIMMSLPDAPEPLEVAAQVIRVVAPPTAPSTACELGIAFGDLAPAARERITRFVRAAQLDTCRQKVSE